MVDQSNEAEEAPAGDACESGESTGHPGICALDWLRQARECTNAGRPVPPMPVPVIAGLDAFEAAAGALSLGRCLRVPDTQKSFARTLRDQAFRSTVASLLGASVQSRIDALRRSIAQSRLRIRHKRPSAFAHETELDAAIKGCMAAGVDFELVDKQLRAILREGSS